VIERAETAARPEPGKQASQAPEPAAPGRKSGVMDAHDSEPMIGDAAWETVEPDVDEAGAAR